MQATAYRKIPANSESIKKAIAAKMPHAAYDSWIAPLEISIFENVLNIVAQNQFSVDFIRRTYINALESAAAEFGLSVSLNVRRMTKVSDCSVNDNIVQKEFIRQTADGRDAKSKKSGFDGFIVSEENAFALSAAKKIASVAVSFSPLFIYGAAGCGKSMLANCINSAARGRALMMTGAQFVSEFLRAINEKSVFAFKDFCRNCDVFILDDVQILSGKRACTDEFVALILDLIKSGVNVVLTANAAPAGLAGFDRRVQSVFASGLTADLAAPNKTVRRAMLGRAGLTADVADSLAGRIAADGHLVAGVMKKIGAYAELMGEKVTFEIAEKLLADSLSGNKTPLGMVRAMCEKMGVSFDAVCSPARSRALVRARQIMMFALKTATKLSLAEIGRLIGDRDHATVLYAISQIEKMKNTDLMIAAELEQAIAECN
jgi:chromosomal replication initiator protein